MCKERSIWEIEKGRSLSGCVLRWQGYFRYAFWDGTSDEKTRNDNAYLVQAWVLGFDNTLRCLEAFGDGGCSRGLGVPLLVGHPCERTPRPSVSCLGSIG